MYRKKDGRQLTFDEFILPFEGHLSAENRWVKAAKLIPWDYVEALYAETFNNKRADGRGPLSARIAFGALFIKEYENLTDERTVEFIAENPYAQYFLGLSVFKQGELFNASMMTHFRKRFPTDIVNKVNEELGRRTPPPPQKPPSDAKTKEDGNSNNNENKGSLILDATACPADVRYPTDLSLLNECRLNTEKMIEDLWAYGDKTGHKTAYSRKVAKKNYMSIAKQRKPRKAKLMKAVKKQLEYVKKNIATLAKLQEALPDKLPAKNLKRLETIQKVVEQQEKMLNNKTHSVEDRIVNLRQPHVRPIVRGKVKAPVEFGQKIALSVVDGFTFIDEQSWDNFNEGTTLIASVEKYKARCGYYPQAVLADAIYRNQTNRAYCKEHGIRLSGPPLGRRKANQEAAKAQAYRDSCARNLIECKIGNGKRRFGLALIMAILENTAQTEVAMNFFALNVAFLIRALLRLILEPRFGWELVGICG